jgi:hypothetical protein
MGEGGGGGGVGHAPRFGSSGKAGEEREATLPPMSALHMTPPQLGDMVYRQVGNVN